MLVPKASELTSQFTYELPDTITRDVGRQREYQLRIYKQAGSPDEPIEIAVTVPTNTRIITANPTPTRQEGRTAHFSLILDSDQSITITFD